MPHQLTCPSFVSRFPLKRVVLKYVLQLPEICTAPLRRLYERRITSTGVEFQFQFNSIQKRVAVPITGNNEKSCSVPIDTRGAKNKFFSNQRLFFAVFFGIIVFLFFLVYKIKKNKNNMHILYIAVHLSLISLL